MTDIVNLLGGSFYTIVVFILALSIIVTIHEYGHYIIGKWCGIKADVFSIGFGKPLLQYQGKDGTLWQIASLPLGGYVKFAGDANAASALDPHALDGLSEQQKRQTMHGAPLWARTATVAAGPIFNFIFSVLVFAAFVFFSGTAGERAVVDNIADTPFEVHLLEGDKITSIEGIEISSITDFWSELENIPSKSSVEYGVLRGDENLIVSGPHPFPVLVSGIAPKSAARDAGLQVGDVITAVNDRDLFSFREMQDVISSSNGEALQLNVWRHGEELEMSLSPRLRDIPKEGGGFETRRLIGVNGGLLFSFATEPAGFLEAFTYGIKQVWQIITLSLSGMYHMIIGTISTCNLSGPIGIAETVSTSASTGWQAYIYTIAVISTAIGLMNLFPIPVLDGGHLLFYTYEAIRGKPLPEKAAGYLMSAGMIFILSIMVLGLGADLLCV